MNHRLQLQVFNKDTIAAALCPCVLGLGKGHRGPGWAGVHSVLPCTLREGGREEGSSFLQVWHGACLVKRDPEAGSRTLWTELSLHLPMPANLLGVGEAKCVSLNTLNSFP